MTTIFISHGSPMLALENEPTTFFLRELSSKIKKPSAIVIASAHFETEKLTLTGALKPKTIHDFYGFPKELYNLRYPAFGNPNLAEKIKSLFVNSGLEAQIDYVRGLDHGAWNPLLLMYPDVDIPVVELSIQPQKNANWHYKIGQLLQPLKAENILIIGTGNLTHNLYEAFRGGHNSVPSWVTEFADWMAEKLINVEIEDLLKWNLKAPHALKNHPTPEHLLPLFIALGAANSPLKIQRLNVNTAMNVLAMDAYLFED